MYTVCEDSDANLFDCGGCPRAEVGNCPHYTKMANAILDKVSDAMVGELKRQLNL